MPSLDTIRTVTIRGQTDGVDQATAALNKLTASIAAANDNLAKTNAIAKSNSEGFAITGEGAASAANHLRQAAEAAYVFSPAFRGVVNELSVPVLKGAGVALEAVAGGIITATNATGTGLVRLGTAAETAFPAFAVLAGSVKTAGAAMEAFSPTIGGAAVSIASKLLPALSLLGKALLIYDAIKLVTQAWELGNAKLAEYVALSEKAATSGVSTDFYQRITKSAEDAKRPIEELTAAFKRLSEAAAPTLGGTAAKKRLDELVEAGNFGNNSGVSALEHANSNEERLRSLRDLVDKALAKGERLAALDIAKAFGGEQLANNLAKDSGYLDKMIEAADEIAQKELIPAATIQRAVELQERLDAAEKILSQRWHPIQDILTNLGIKMKEIWVDIVEAIAKAVDSVFKLGEGIAGALSPLTGFLHTAGEILSKAAPMLALAPGGLGLPLAAGTYVAGKVLGTGDSGNTDTAQRDALLQDAKKRLAEGMNRKFDRSNDPGKKIEETTAAYQRAEESLRKYIETSDAAAKSIDMTVDAQERLKAIAQLTAAGMKDGLTREAAAAKAQLSGLAEQAGIAALNLEKARIASDIKFGANTSLLSQQDVQIAAQLKGIYPDVATALHSVEAQALRANNAFKEISSAIENELTQGLTDIATGAKTAGEAFSDMGLAIVKAIEQMVIKLLIVEPLMRALQESIGGSGLLGSLFGGGGLTSGLGSLAAIHHTGGIVGEGGMPSRNVSSTYFNDNTPRFHTGGIAGDEVPIIAKRGEGIFTAAQMAALGQGSAPQVNVTLIESPNAAGSVTQKQNANGGLDIEVAVSQIAAKSAATPGNPLNRVLTDQLGSRQRLASR